MAKTFYLWDLAETLFPQRWDAVKSGFVNFEAYAASLGYDVKTMSAHDFEWSHEWPYRAGLYDVAIADGFQEVLSWTKHNGVFTTGNPEQIDWRAEQLQRKYGFDIRDYLAEIYSTFDYGDTNLKTPAMLMDILRKKYQDGYGTVVYTDDKEENCRFFLDAVVALNQEDVPLAARAYHVRNDKGVFEEKSENFFAAANLLQLLAHEKSLA